MIRLATQHDEAKVRDCAEQAYARYIPLIGKRPAPLLSDFGAQIRDGLIHVAEADEGSFQGFIVFYQTDQSFLLENVAVLPAWSGKGVGRALIAYCEDAARRVGALSVRLYTNAAMVDNVALYARLGYSEISRARQNGFDRVFFEKGL